MDGARARGAGSGTWRAVSLVAAVMAVGSPGCTTPEERMTPSQYINANSNILRQLASYNDVEQREGIERIRGLGREQGSAVALYILSDRGLEDHRVQVVLARILADWKHPGAIGYLLENLTVQDRGAATRAADGLAAFGDYPRVIDALAEMLTNPSAEERMIAAETLAKIRSPRVAGLFIERFKAETDPQIRGRFLVTVIQSSHPERRAFLVDALTDADEAIRSEAWSALSKYRGLPRVDYSPTGAIEERAREVAKLRIWLRSAKRS
ncbi:MAG TPA: HEAT repeat domain-containing protein [Planctomycetota bacterium]|nr:HEAT repeat domain-containing protein [Planctomycetota bacterium]